MSLFSMLVGRHAHSRRRGSASRISPETESFESRSLLSGVALYPLPAQVAAEVGASSGKVTVAAVPPGDFSGSWKLSTSEGLVTADIGQDGKKLEIVLNHEGTILPATGKVKGDTFRAKIKTVILGYKVRGKMSSELTGPVTMAGNLSVKVPGAIPKIESPFVGVRV